MKQIVASDGSTELLKWIGLVLMTGDHINKFLFNATLPVLFELGRLCLPIFVFVLAYNLARPGALARHVHQRTLIRLGVFGLLASLPRIYLGGLYQGWCPLNVLFTLMVIVATVYLVERGASTSGLRRWFFLWVGRWLSTGGLRSRWAFASGGTARHLRRGHCLAHCSPVSFWEPSMAITGPWPPSHSLGSSSTQAFLCPACVGFFMPTTLPTWSRLRCFASPWPVRATYFLDRWHALRVMVALPGGSSAINSRRTRTFKQVPWMRALLSEALQQTGGALKGAQQQSFTPLQRAVPGPPYALIHFLPSFQSTGRSGA